MGNETWTDKDGEEHAERRVNDADRRVATEDRRSQERIALEHTPRRKVPDRRQP